MPLQSQRIDDDFNAKRYVDARLCVSAIVYRFAVPNCIIVLVPEGSNANAAACDAACSIEVWLDKSSVIAAHALWRVERSGITNANRGFILSFTVIN